MLKTFLKHTIIEQAITSLFGGLERNLIKHSPNGLCVGKKYSEITIEYNVTDHLYETAYKKIMTCYDCQVTRTDSNLTEFTYHSYKSHKVYEDGSTTPPSTIRDNGLNGLAYNFIIPTKHITKYF